MSGELIVWTVMVMGFVIGATIWWRCERYFKFGKAILMILCAVVAVIGGRLAGLWFGDLRDDQVLTALLVIGGLSAVLGIPFCEGLLFLRTKMKERSKNQ
jgi:hypothetical protein